MSRFIVLWEYKANSIDAGVNWKVYQSSTLIVDRLECRGFANRLFKVLKGLFLVWFPTEPCFFPGQVYQGVGKLTVILDPYSHRPT